jgi:hypothetical protein
MPGHQLDFVFSNVGRAHFFLGEKV